MDTEAFEIKYLKFSENHLEKIIELEKEWVLENITYGVVGSTKEEIMQNVNDYFYLALHNEKVVGYIICEEIHNNEYNIFENGSTYLRVNDIYVLKEYRNKKIGENLLKIIEEKAKTNEIKQILISTATKEAETIKRFYERNRYKIWTQIFFKN